ncbi:MAG TPA: acetyl-CoA carboxylase biotin carboxyl carrier protein subunit [Pilimelia sp.]|nr:acetyl-CoA carboxylase biotin carboxyl carrier protein subunit [Pilimelia sp.]
MTDPMPHEAPQARPDDLAALGAAAGALARGLPGPLHRVALHSGDLAVELEWHPAAPRPAAAAAPSGAAADPPAPAEAVADRPGPGAPPDGADGVLVRAPLVGTFYAAPRPGADPFVAVGDVVEAGQPLAIVEAMKLLNEITAGCAGRVAELLVADGAGVDYDQPLMRLTPVPEGEPR